MIQNIFESSTKQSVSCCQSEIDDALLQWFKIQSSYNSPIGSAILQVKADYFTRHFTILNVELDGFNDFGKGIILFV